MKKRPAGVWVIFIFEICSVALILFGSYLIFSGSVPLPADTQSYLASTGLIGLLISVLIGALNLAGAISLFLLRKISIKFFIAALVLNVLLTIVQIFQTNLLQALNPVSLLIGWVIALAIIFYARNLSKRGILS